VNTALSAFNHVKRIKSDNGFSNIPNAIAFHSYGSKQNTDIERRELMRAVYMKLYHAHGYPAEMLEAKALTHSPLGQPLISDRVNGVEATSSDHHISFSHDGEFHIALGAVHSDLAGVGVDLVHLRRLYRRFPTKSSNAEQRSYLLKLAERVLTNAEWRMFASQSASMDIHELVVQFASFFSMKEAVSKSLGVGLKLGLGIGKEQSISLQSINIGDGGASISLLFESEKRMKELGGGEIIGLWTLLSGYIISRAFVMR
jgi:phosphopantetheine--protein transferase-like protein